MRDTASANLTRCGEWLNIVMHEIASRSDYWDWLQATDTLAIVAGTQDYTLSSAIATDIKWIRTIRIEDSGGWILTPLTLRSAEQFYPDPDLSTGRPEAYTILGAGTSIRIYPDPDANYTAQIDYLKTITDLSADADLPPWPRYWDHVWLFGAEAYGKDFAGIDGANVARARFEKGVREMLAGESRVPNAIIRGR